MSHQYRTSSRRPAPAHLGERVPPGHFGRMFPHLPALELEPQVLSELAKLMIRKPPADHESAGIPAGYTFLGQFIDHDMTFDVTELRPDHVDPRTLTNYRTPALDLDCLYGRGPDADPLFYGVHDRAEFRIESTQPTPKEFHAEFPTEIQFDLQRAETTRIAAIPDARNDENLIIGQLHVAMQKFHNQVVRDLREANLQTLSPLPASPEPSDYFNAARKIVTLFYHGIVLEEFLPCIIPAEVLQKVRAEGSLLYRHSRAEYVPVEFSVGAYRFGHATVRDEYEYNCVFSTDGPGKKPAQLMDLFLNASGNRGPQQIPLLITDWVIDWRRFFPGLGDAGLLNLSRPVGTALPDTFGQLPGFHSPANLAERNMLRGNEVGLPSGQEVAREFGYEPLGPDEIGEDAAHLKLGEHTPLWYYVLREAEVRMGGRTLGETGGRIVAEVIIGMLQHDPASLLNYKSAQPVRIQGKSPGDFRMADLLTYSRFVNPLGDLPQPTAAVEAGS